MENFKTFFKMLKQLNQILAKKEKGNLAIVVIGSIIGAFLETLGVSAILPLILALLSPQDLMKYDSVMSVLDFLNIHTEKGMVVGVACGVILLFVMKNAYLAIFGAYKYRYQNRIESNIADDLCKMYINMPYTELLGINSAEIEKAVTSDASAVSACIERFCILANELLTCALLVILLFCINPILALVLAGLAGVLTLVIIQALKKRISMCGEGARLAYIDKTKSILEIVGGIKEILILKRQQFFYKRFCDSVESTRRWNTEYLILSSLPNKFVEVVFIIGIVCLMVTTYLVSGNAEMLMAQFGAVGVAAIRILPATSNISNSITALVFHRPYLENAHEIIMNDNIDISEVIYEDEKRRFKDELRIDNVYWKYEKDLPYVLENISVRIKKGEAIGIIGESGAGKSTFVDILLGLLKPSEGHISVDDMDIFEADTRWSRMVGYVPQTIFLLDDTIKKNILFGLDDPNDDSKLWSVIEKAQLKDYVNSLPEGINTVLGERGIKLSGGQRQRIAIARALYCEPDVLVLDEATSALDNEVEKALMDAINLLQGDKTLIIVAHRLSTVENCDRIYKIENGHMYLKSKEEVFG